MTFLSRRGQSIGEHAILFAIVLGAVVAMQNYVRNRIASRIQQEADNWVAGTTITQSSTGTSTSGMTMSSAGAGTITASSGGTSTITNPE